MSEDILGVKIDNLSQAEISNKVRKFLEDPHFHQIATVNPEFILTAQQNPVFRHILNNTDLNLPDGVGLHLAFWLQGLSLKFRWPGADLLEYILEIAQELNLPIFLVCREDGLSHYEEIKKLLEEKYPKSIVLGLSCPRQSVDIAENIPDDAVVLCNFGAPWQEIFLFGLKNAKIRLSLGVGGSFDYLTKKLPRAPKAMRKLGLEWLWRLILQPKRIKRIFRATIVFPWLLIKNNFKLFLKND